MLAKVIIVMTAVVFVGTMSAGSEAWARGGRGGHGGGKGSGWAGKGMHGKHGRHFPGQMHHARKKHDHGHKNNRDQAQGTWQKGNKSSDFSRNWQAGGFAGGGGGGYGDSVGDVCINSQFCQGVGYRSGYRSESSAGYQRSGQGEGK